MSSRELVYQGPRQFPRDIEKMARECERMATELDRLTQIISGRRLGLGVGEVLRANGQALQFEGLNRAEPSAAGLTLVLPRATERDAGREAVLAVESDAGAVTVVAVGALLNRAQSITLQQEIGRYTFSWDGTEWWGPAAVGSPDPATRTLSSMRRTKSQQQAISTSAEVVTWETELEAAGDIGFSNNTTFVAPSAGIFLVLVSLEWAVGEVATATFVVSGGSCSGLVSGLDAAVGHELVGLWRPSGQGDTLQVSADSSSAATLTTDCTVDVVELPTEVLAT